ncbi:MAG: YicC family protein [Bacteroidetes bacterium]|nr:YicC family protein [Bacteroidota bacterium]MBL0138382.1 YicC family protein [Bacteroidota bacterium]
MIRSMTGFGNATIEHGNKTISVEIKSVNSKFFDLTLRLPSLYREKEFEIRGDLSKQIERGKVECSISVESQEAPKKSSINSALVKAYYEELKTISDDLKLPPANFLKIILGLPDVLNTEKNQLDEEEWAAVKKAIEKAVAAFQEFRKMEGASLSRDLEQRIQAIDAGMKDLEIYEAGRIELVRKRLQLNLEEFIQVNNIDRNRFEQELIFYIEKYDISEEKVRLKSHLNYFLKTMKDDPSGGKKLSFIGQEIGREVNTIGSKANDANMQKSVVGMKDELERIKEQVLNIL